MSTPHPQILRSLPNPGTREQGSRVFTDGDDHPARLGRALNPRAGDGGPGRGWRGAVAGRGWPGGPGSRREREGPSPEPGLPPPRFQTPGVWSRWRTGVCCLRPPVRCTLLLIQWRLLPGGSSASHPRHPGGPAQLFLSVSLFQPGAWSPGSGQQAPGLTSERALLCSPLLPLPLHPQSVSAVRAQTLIPRTASLTSSPDAWSCAVGIPSRIRPARSASRRPL